MRLLIVSATSLEIKPLLNTLGKGRVLRHRITRYRYKHFQVDVLITGVGMVPTATGTAIALASYKHRDLWEFQSRFGPWQCIEYKH